MNKFGICCAPSQAKSVLAAGFDYVELPATVFKAGEERWDHAPMAGLTAPVCNMVFPGTMKLLGPQPPDYMHYARVLFERAEAHGTRLFVVGSPHARHAPDHMNLDEAEDAFVKICAEMNRLGKKHHMHVVPEPQNRNETNVGNDMAALAALCEKHHVGYVVDSFHIRVEWEADGREGGRPHPSDAWWKKQIPGLPEHVHLAGAERAIPSSKDPFLAGFCRRLKTLGYKGRVSLECRIADWAKEPPAALAEAKTLFHKDV